MTKIIFRCKFPKNKVYIITLLELIIVLKDKYVVLYGNFD